MNVIIDLKKKFPITQASRAIVLNNGNIKDLIDLQYSVRCFVSGLSSDLRIKNKPEIFLILSYDLSYVRLSTSLIY